MSQPITFTTLVVGAGTVGNPGMAKSNLAGTGFLLSAASAPLNIQFSGGTVFPVSAGFVINPGSASASPASGFTSVTFFNPTANAITVAFYVFQNGVNYVGTNQQKDVSSRAVGGGIINLAANTITAAITGTNNGNQRKQIIIHNLDANLQLYILDGPAGNVVDVIYAGQPWTLPTDAAVYVQNPNAAGVNYCVGQFFYNS